MTIDHFARCLRLPTVSLYKLTQDSRVPGQKVGHGPFSRAAIDRWLEQLFKRDNKEDHKG